MSCAVKGKPMRSIALPIALLSAVMALPAKEKVIPKDTEFHVKLLSPVDTLTSKKGDKLTAQVTAPSEFTGDVMEGIVRESKGGKKLKGKAVLSIGFEVLNHAEERVPVQAAVKSLVNSHGKENVDEEGQVIRKKNQLAKAAAGAGVGALIGGMAAGGAGAAIGALAGGAAMVVLVQMGTDGARISFAPGSEFILSVKQRK
jgi:hypothetical protein